LRLGNDPGGVVDALHVRGDEGLLRMAEAWHARVMADEVVSHAFSHGFYPQHSEWLAAYWAEALGGPHTYSERHGDESAVVRIHTGNGPHVEMDKRAISCFDRALDDVGLTDRSLRQVLHEYFAWATTTTMSAYLDYRRRCPAGTEHPALVLGRPTAAAVLSENQRVTKSGVGSAVFTNRKTRFRQDRLGQLAWRKGRSSHARA
jgi:hemoglobin